MPFNLTSSKIKTIISHEYITRVKSKGFIIGTILAPIGMLMILVIPALVALLSMDQTTKKLAILDYSNLIGKEIVATDTSKYFLTTDSPEILEERILAGELDGYLNIPADIIQKGDAQLFTSGGGGIGYLTLLDRNLNNVVRRHRLVEAGAEPSTIDFIETKVSLKANKVTKKGTETDFTAIYAGLGYALGFMIYILMLLYGQLVMRGVIEEKANRIIEIIASSARPIEIMMGKVLGIGLVGLTQVVFWVILAATLFAIIGPILGLMSPDMSMANQPGMEMMQQDTDKMYDIMSTINELSISPWIGIAFIFYFLAGYFIYSALFAAVGSAVDQESDAQQLMIPITIPIIIPIFFIFNIISNPDSTLAVILSLFPFFSPILMIVRIAATTVPLWQIVLSVVLLIATFYFCLWMAAKIYRVGILMYGKKPSFKDIFKWLKLAD